MSLFGSARALKFAAALMAVVGIDPHADDHVGPGLLARRVQDLLGGARSMMVGNLIQHEYLVARDWPLGSALSLVMMLIVTGSIVWYLRAQAPRDGERGAG